MSATKAMLKALRRASTREHGNICPIVGIHANAETVLLNAMDARGFIAWDNPNHKVVPRISEAGRALVDAEAAQQ